MPTIKINGQALEFDGKKTVLQVATEHGVEIPHYCWHPGLSVVASCRICLAEIAQPNPRNDNKVELIPKLLPTCQTMAIDQMEVHTDSPKSIANQKAVMEYLLINHPLDCPVCDQAGECYLQDYSYRYGRSESRFLEEKIKQPKKDVGDHVLLYSDRCIMCTRCVRFTREVTGTDELAVFGRGSKEQIDVFPGKALNNELSGNVVDICPVGALLDKDFLFAQRVWYLKETPSIDGITSSGDNIWVHHNEGQVYRVKPRTNLQVNKWWISDEIRFGWKFVHSDDRLSKPTRLQFNDATETTWERAYKDAYEGLSGAVKDNGDGSLAAVISPMLSCEEAYLLAKYVRALDSKARLVIGPVPTDGEDKEFPGGYTVRAEKCPNRRGVERVLKQVISEGSDNGEEVEPMSYNAFLEMIGEKKHDVAGLLITGNYPSDWTTKELVAGLKRTFVVMIETLANALSAKANVMLPGATWVEKHGTFENADGKLQVFEQAIPVKEIARPEGQIALDLMAASYLGERAIFDAAKVREQMGGVFVDEVELPSRERRDVAEMEYVEL